LAATQNEKISENGNQDEAELENCDGWKDLKKAVKGFKGRYNKT